MVRSARGCCRVFSRKTSNDWKKFTEVARLLTGDPQATVAEGVRWLEKLVDLLHIPRLGGYGVTPAHLPQLVQQAQQASSMKGNPVVLPPEVLTRILAEAL